MNQAEQLTKLFEKHEDTIRQSLVDATAEAAVDILHQNSATEKQIEDITQAWKKVMDASVSRTPDLEQTQENIEHLVQVIKNSINEEKAPEYRKDLAINFSMGFLNGMVAALGAVVQVHEDLSEILVQEDDLEDPLPEEEDRIFAWEAWCVDPVHIAAVNAHEYEDMPHTGEIKASSLEDAVKKLTEEEYRVVSIKEFLPRR